MVASLEEIINTSGTDCSKYTQEQKNVVAASMSVAKAIKSVLDTPLLTEDGELTDESKKVADNMNGFLDSQNS